VNRSLLILPVHLRAWSSLSRTRRTFTLAVKRFFRMIPLYYVAVITAYRVDKAYYQASSIIAHSAITRLSKMLLCNYAFALTKFQRLVRRDILIWCRKRATLFNRMHSDAKVTSIDLILISTEDKKKARNRTANTPRTSLFDRSSSGEIFVLINSFQSTRISVVIIFQTGDSITNANSGMC